MRCGSLTFALARGFTLLELMVTVSVAMILAAMAVPSFSSQMENYRLQAASERLYADLQFARLEAIRSNQNVRVSFTSGSQWCYGLILGETACDCSVSVSSASNYCSLKRVTHADFSRVSIPDAASITFSDRKTGFDPVRGIALNAGSVTLQSTAGNQARIMLAALGLVTVCAPAGTNLSGYPAC